MPEVEVAQPDDVAAHEPRRGMLRASGLLQSELDVVDADGVPPKSRERAGVPAGSAAEVEHPAGRAGALLPLAIQQPAQLRRRAATIRGGLPTV